MNTSQRPPATPQDSGPWRQNGHARFDRNPHVTPSLTGNFDELASEAGRDVRGEQERRHSALLEGTHIAIRQDLVAFKDAEAQLPRVEDVTALIHGAEVDLEYEFATTDHLRALWESVQFRRRALRVFRRDHGLRRPARYPTSLRRHFASVAVIAFIEALANAVFFAPTSDFGLVGGLLQAVVVAGVNALAAVIAGLVGVRHLIHPRRALRYLTSALLVAYAASAVGFNLAVGRWRDLAASGVAPHERFHDLMAHPLELSLPSAVLCFIGLVASALCVWKGYRGDDPVPGYRDVDIAFLQAEQAFAEACGRARTSVLSAVSLVAERAEALLSRAIELLDTLETIAVRITATADRYEAGRQNEQNVGEIVLRRWRDENSAVRTTPPPLYFGVIPRIESGLDHSLLRGLGGRLDRARQRVDTLRSEANRIRMGGAERVARARARFDTVLQEHLRQADAGRGDGSDIAHRSAAGGGR